MSLIAIFAVSYIVGCGGSKDIAANEQQQASAVPKSTSDSSQSEQPTVPEIDEEQFKQDSLKKVYKDRIYRENQVKANRITTFYIQAQQKSFNGEYEEALFLINQALRIKETPDALALKGSIYFGLGSTENFVIFWIRALELDPDIPLPPSPVIVQELRRQGLIE